MMVSPANVVGVVAIILWAKFASLSSLAKSHFFRIQYWKI